MREGTEGETEVEEGSKRKRKRERDATRQTILAIMQVGQIILDLM